MLTNKKIILAGGSGFIGQALCNYFGKDNRIVIIGRQIPGTTNNSFGKNNLLPEVLVNTRYVQWDGKSRGEWTNEIDGADMVINLAGKSVNCRYSKKNKKEIFDSRTNATKVIAEAIKQAIKPPVLWLNAVSATIYPNATNEPRDESFTDFKDDFSVQVCKLWEKTFYEQRTPFTRKVALRMAITLGKGGVMTPYFNLLKFGLGGRQGSGKQMYSWVHVQDVCRMIEYFFEDTQLEGTFNCSSPNPVNNETFMATLRNITKTKFGLPAYKWMLKIGSIIIGTEPELVLKSRWVIPAKITKAGFNFKYPLLQDAIKEIVAQTDRLEYKIW